MHCFSEKLLSSVLIALVAIPMKLINEELRVGNLGLEECTDSHWRCFISPFSTNVGGAHAGFYISNAFLNNGCLQLSSCVLFVPKVGTMDNFYRFCSMLMASLCSS